MFSIKISTKNSSIPPVPLSNAQPSTQSAVKRGSPAPVDVSAHRMHRAGFQLCIARARSAKAQSRSHCAPSPPSPLQRARQMVRIGLERCERYRRLAEVDGLPDDGAFPAAEEFFADAFAQHVDGNSLRARYFTAGWLSDGLEAHDLRDTVAHFDRLSVPDARLASETLARAWNVARDRHAFSHVLCSFAVAMPESHLQAALEGVARALADAPDLGRHRACLAQFASSRVMRTEAGQAAWSAVADTVFARAYTPELPAPGQAGKRKREAARETKQDGDASDSGSTAQWASGCACAEMSGSTSDSREGSPTPGHACPGPQASASELQSFILSVMRPESPTPPSASARASEARIADYDSPAHKQGRAVTPRARSPKA